MSSTNGSRGAGGGVATLTVALVAGTRTRLKVLERLLSAPNIVVCGVSQDAASAESLVLQLRPSAVLLDLDLWGGGLEAIERIMAVRATPIVVIGAAAEHPEAAIAAGAVDVVGDLDLPPGAADYAHLVRRHVTVASRVRVITHPRGRLRSRGLHPMVADPHQSSAGMTLTSTALDGDGSLVARGGFLRPEPFRAGPPVVAIGASTGGPPALATILAELPAGLPAAVLVVQHMAEGFVEGLARWLDGVCPLPVAVAVEGEHLQAGQVYLAPANQNLVLRPGFRVGLLDPQPGQYHVPGVDVTFRSVAEHAGPRSVGVLLTGMGRDGAAGLRMLRDVGASTIGQDEATSVVWGMPGAAQELDAVTVELPLAAVGREVVAAVERAAGRMAGAPS